LANETTTLAVQVFNCPVNGTIGPQRRRHSAIVTSSASPLAVGEESPADRRCGDARGDDRYAQSDCAVEQVARASNS
jgi:hypothetical protein